MKNSLLLIVLFFGFSSGLFSQKINENLVPGPAKETFKQKFPGLAGTWEKENKNFEVNFKAQGKQMSALINDKGDLLETETTIAPGELPASAVSYLRTHYKESSIKSASKVLKQNGQIMYEAEVNKIDVLFDAEGRFIKEEKD